MSTEDAAPVATDVIPEPPPRLITGAERALICRDLWAAHDAMSQHPERGLAIQMVLTVAVRMYARWCPDDPSPLHGFGLLAARAFVAWVTVEAETPGPGPDPFDGPPRRLRP